MSFEPRTDDRRVERGGPIFPDERVCEICLDLTEAATSGTTLSSSSLVVALVPTRVRIPGAAIVAPRRHANSILAIGSSELAELAKVVNATALLIEQTYCPDGLNVWWSVGTLAGQSDPHLCVEIVPRYHQRQYRYVDRLSVDTCSVTERVEIARKLLSGRISCEPIPEPHFARSRT